MAKYVRKAPVGPKIPKEQKLKKKNPKNPKSPKNTNLPKIKDNAIKEKKPNYNEKKKQR